MKNSNPIVDQIIDKFNTVQAMTEMFVTGDSAINGLLVHGNAGLGKTHFVKKAFIETDSEESVQYIKGSSMSAAALYCILYANREKGDVVVLDDVDIIHKSSGEISAILDLFKGATEPTKGSRILGWQRASANQLMRDNGVPMEFDFQGSIIWITNDSTEDIAKKAKGHWTAISSRFRQVPAWLNDQEKLMYTLYLVEEINMLGKDCEAIEGGFTEDVIKDTVAYIRKNYRLFNDITPRVAIMIADLRSSYPTKWEVYADNQLISQ